MHCVRLREVAVMPVKDPALFSVSTTRANKALQDTCRCCYMMHPFKYQLVLVVSLGQLSGLSQSVAHPADVLFEKLFYSGSESLVCPYMFCNQKLQF